MADIDLILYPLIFLSIMMCVTSLLDLITTFSTRKKGDKNGNKNKKNKRR